MQAAKANLGLLLTFLEPVSPASMHGILRNTLGDLGHSRLRWAGAPIPTRAPP